MTDASRPFSLPLMGSVDLAEPSVVGKSASSAMFGDDAHLPTPVAARLDPPHKGEGGRSIRLLAIDHVQLAIPAGGEDAARAFYSGVLGLIEQPKPPELAKRGGCWFGGAVKVHLGVEEPFRPANKAHIAFRVDDVRGLAEAARASGRKVVEDRDLPGHERVFVFDPFGNRLEFLRAVVS